MPVDLYQGRRTRGQRVGDHAHRDSQPSASRHTQAQRRKSEARITQVTAMTDVAAAMPASRDATFLGATRSSDRTNAKDGSRS